MPSKIHAKSTEVLVVNMSAWSITKRATEQERLKEIFYLIKTILRAGLNLMFHINTGCMADDHTTRAFWVGERR